MCFRLTLQCFDGMALLELFEGGEKLGCRTAAALEVFLLDELSELLLRDAHNLLKAQELRLPTPPLGFQGRLPLPLLLLRRLPSPPQGLCHLCLCTSASCCEVQTERPDLHLPVQHLPDALRRISFCCLGNCTALHQACPLALQALAQALGLRLELLHLGQGKLNAMAGPFLALPLILCSSSQSAGVRTQRLSVVVQPPGRRHGAQTAP
mmetsp:Transcript_92792/g.198982  ORF Transcript_92792/g.198982 Transcript_92792/m.198982 type:complete len:209 (+) Transcript_92792:828-1454(+)